MRDNALFLSRSIWFLIASISAILIPSAIDIWRSILPTEDGQVVPIVLGVGIWLLWRKWLSIPAKLNREGPAFGLAVLAASSLLFSFGFVFDRVTPELYGAYGILVGAVTYLMGWQFTRQLSVPLIALLFAIPVPARFTELLTMDAKNLATDISVSTLNFMHFSTVRDGFNIIIDQYVLLVKDACSGMNSLISITWAGLVYLYLARQPPLYYYALMIIPAICFAILANVFRIIILCLLTRFFGDGVAQGPLHETAGLLMFSVALSSMFILDSSFQAIARSLVGQNKP